MARQPPPGLPDAHRDALSEFFHGRLSAGQLTERLSDGQPPQTPAAATAEPKTVEMPELPRSRRSFRVGRRARAGGSG